MDISVAAISGFAEAVVSIFVIVNPLGNLPLFAGLAEEVPDNEKRRVFHLAGVVAFCILSAFAVVGKYVMRDIFHISIAEFTFGGGLLLVVIGVYNIMARSRRPAPAIEPHDSAAVSEQEITLAVSPIAFPLLVGPGSIVTVMLIVDRHGSIYHRTQGVCGRRHPPRPESGGVGDPRGPSGGTGGRRVSHGCQRPAALIGPTACGPTGRAAAVLV